jgi:hypothetical protein
MEGVLHDHLFPSFHITCHFDFSRHIHFVMYVDIYISTCIAKEMYLEKTTSNMKRMSTFTRTKRGAIFAPTMSHVINKTTVVGSRVDGSDNPHTTNTVHKTGPTICR